MKIQPYNLFFFFFIIFLFFGCSGKNQQTTMNLDKTEKKNVFYILNDINIKVTPDSWIYEKQPYLNFFSAISKNKKIIAYGNVFKIEKQKPVFIINYIVKNNKIIQINKQVFSCKEENDLKDLKKINFGYCLILKRN